MSRNVFGNFTVAYLELEAVVERASLIFVERVAQSSVIYIVLAEAGSWTQSLPCAAAEELQLTQGTVYRLGQRIGELAGRGVGIRDFQFAGRDQTREFQSSGSVVISLVL